MQTSGLMLITRINFFLPGQSVQVISIRVPSRGHQYVKGAGTRGMVGHLVSGGESKGPAALLWGRRRNRKQGPTAHLLPAAAAAAAGCNALQEEKVGRHS